VTVRDGFRDVISAFQTLPGLDADRFYSGDHRSGIVIHDSLAALANSIESTNLCQEVEARWRLVESAWNLRLPPHALEAHLDQDSEQLFLLDLDQRRTTLTAVRPALNAYQKGECFYCQQFISVDSGNTQVSHVDHFLPFSLNKEIAGNLNGIWNLVLACANCNLSKSARVPHEELAARWSTRNEWYCASKHPLSETIQLQTGSSRPARLAFLRARFHEAAASSGADTSLGWRAK
jgi:5-methylcytosine-specific restriction endonuclease McrA